MKAKTLGLTLICCGALALSGCGDDSSPSPEEDQPTSTGIGLTLDVGAVAGVDAFRFNIDTCAGEDVISEEVALSELEFDEEMDLDLEGSTVFADYFATVDAGCYDVELVPLDEQGDAVGHCSVATAEDIEVDAGETTEIVMISECGQQDPGGLDVLGALNFSPTITKLEFEPSKVVGCDSVRVCATAIDSDGDDIEFSWTQREGPTPQQGPEVVSSTEENGLHTECIEMTPVVSGSYVFEVTAHDMMEDENGEAVRVEDMAQELDEEFRSFASLAFPLHVSCEDPPEDVLEEIEDKKEKPEEDVLGEVEDEEKDEKTEKERKKKEDEEDVLGEVEDEKKDKKTEKEREKKEDEEDVLGEVEDEKKDKKTEKEREKKEDEEDVLSEVEDEKEDKKTEKEREKKEDEEDVLGEVEDEKEDKKEYEKVDVLAEIEDKKHEPDEDVLGELEDKKDKPEEVLAELENCTWAINFWRTFNRFADDPEQRVDWPIDEETVLRDHTWFELVTMEFTKKLTWGKLAQQYIVARLNIAAGADSTKTIDKVLIEAEQLLELEELRGADRIRAKDLEQMLRAFNEGQIGPGACPDA